MVLLEYYFAACALAAHYIYACGLIDDSVVSAIHQASLHIIEAYVQTLRIVQLTPLAFADR